MNIWNYFPRITTTTQRKLVCAAALIAATSAGYCIYQRLRSTHGHASEENDLDDGVAEGSHEELGVLEVAVPGRHVLPTEPVLETSVITEFGDVRQSFASMSMRSAIQLSGFSVPFNHEVTVPVWHVLPTEPTHELSSITEFSWNERLNSAQLHSYLFSVNSYGSQFELVELRLYFFSTVTGSVAVAVLLQGYMQTIYILYTDMQEWDCDYEVIQHLKDLMNIHLEETDTPNGQPLANQVVDLTDTVEEAIEQLMYIDLEAMELITNQPLDVTCMLELKDADLETKTVQELMHIHLDDTEEENNGPLGKTVEGIASSESVSEAIKEIIEYLLENLKNDSTLLAGHEITKVTAGQAEVVAELVVDAETAHSTVLATEVERMAEDEPDVDCEKDSNDHQPLVGDQVMPAIGAEAMAEADVEVLHADLDEMELNNNQHKRKTRRGTRGKGRKINYKKPQNEDMNQHEEIKVKQNYPPVMTPHEREPEPPPRQQKRRAEGKEQRRDTPTWNGGQRRRTQQGPAERTFAAEDGRRRTSSPRGENRFLERRSSAPNKRSTASERSDLRERERPRFPSQGRILVMGEGGVEKNGERGDPNGGIMTIGFK